jgi:hypothetical protein
MKLLDTQTTNTDGNQTTFQCKGGMYLIQTDGEFGGATVTIQGRMENFEWQDLLDEAGDVVEITGPTTKAVTFCMAGFELRASLTGASGTTDVSVGMLVS